MKLFHIARHRCSYHLNRLSSVAPILRSCPNSEKYLRRLEKLNSWHRNYEGCSTVQAQWLQLEKLLDQKALFSLPRIPVFRPTYVQIWEIRRNISCVYLFQFKDRMLICSTEYSSPEDVSEIVSYLYVALFAKTIQI